MELIAKVAALIVQEVSKVKEVVDGIVTVLGRNISDFISDGWDQHH
jgi:hypothetical protein